MNFIFPFIDFNFRIMQEIHIKLDESVVKFLRIHLTKRDEQCVIDQKNDFGKRIIQFISEAPNGYRPPEDCNMKLILNSSGWIRQKQKLDTRYHAFYISETSQKDLNIFFKKFIKTYFCVWCYKQKIDHPGTEEKKLIEEFKQNHGFSEDEITSHSLHVAYWRFVKSMKNPDEFLIKNLGLIL